MGPLLFPTPSDTKSFFIPVSRDRKTHKKSIEPDLLVLHTVKKNYVKTLDYRIWLANKSTKRNETVSSYVIEMVETVTSRMKAHLFDPKASICIIGFFATFRLSCDTNRLSEWATLQASPRYVDETLANELNKQSYVHHGQFFFYHRLSAQCWKPIPQTLATVPGNCELLAEEVCHRLIDCRILCWHLLVHAAGQHEATTIRRERSFKIVQGRWRMWGGYTEQFIHRTGGFVKSP